MPDINNINVVDLLPNSLQNDDSIRAAAQAIDGELKAVSNLCMVPAIFSRIDELSSDVLDHMAWQFDSKIWRDSWPVNLKRSVIKTVISEKSKKGTRQALENAVESMGTAVAITEWFETTPQGTPHTFDVTITVGEIDGQAGADVQNDLILRINDIKPVRSHYNLSLATQAVANLYIGGAARPAAYTRLNTVANY